MSSLPERPTERFAETVTSATSAAEVVLTFLESVGRRSDAELYLRLFQKLPKESFALIVPGAPVVRHGLGALAEQLRFLSDLGLYAAVVLGLFDPDSAAAGAERLQKRLSALGLEVRAYDAAEPALAERLREDLRAERIPIVSFTPREGQASAERAAAIGDLARALDTRKIVLLRRRGGLSARAMATRAGRLDTRLSVVNLNTDRDALLAAKRLGKREAELVELAGSLIRESSSLFVSVTSPLNLLKELFTVKGAGTLIKRGSAVQRKSSYAELDQARLHALLEESFGRTLLPGFFERPPLAVYLEADYRGAGIVFDGSLAPYLGKFAVERQAQGEGIGNDLWQAMLRDFPALFWRGRPDNPIDPWYQSVCDGMVRLPEWHVFWRGIAPEHVPEIVARAASFPSDFAPLARAAGDEASTNGGAPPPR